MRSRSIFHRSHHLIASVGQFAIQLAALAGYKVVTTASQWNYDLVTSLGASAVFDYKDADVVEKVKAATGDTIRSVFDTISSADAQALSAAVVAPTGGKVIHVLGLVPEANSRSEVERSCTLLSTMLAEINLTK